MPNFYMDSTPANIENISELEMFSSEKKPLNGMWQQVSLHAVLATVL